MKILVTGSAGFIGFHLTNKLLANGHNVVGLDNINDYYPIGLKFSRLKELGVQQEKISYNQIVHSDIHNSYKYVKLNLEDSENINKLFHKEKFDVVINMAAQVGVRFSLDNPLAYVHSNIIGFTNVLEACRYNNIKHLVYASSSSVYGLNEKLPFSVHDNVDHPVSFYAASKKSNELMAHTYSYLYNLPTTGLRFFTVYGPWGRPDMALFKFTDSIIKGKAIDVYNKGKMERDFTYVDDIVDGIVRVMHDTPEPDTSWTGMQPDPASSVAPYRLYNIGASKHINLLDFIKEIEKRLGKKAKLNMMEMQAGDVLKTHADISDLETKLNYSPKTQISEGVKYFIDWYLDYYKV